jgi:hypothetical protein
MNTLQPLTAWSYLPFDDSERQRIAAKHGWDYTSNTPDYDDSYADCRTWNRATTMDDPVGFGGAWTVW